MTLLVLHGNGRIGAINLEGRSVFLQFLLDRFELSVPHFFCVDLQYDLINVSVHGDKFTLYPFIMKGVSKKIYKPFIINALQEVLSLFTQPDPHLTSSNIRTTSEHRSVSY